MRDFCVRVCHKKEECAGQKILLRWEMFLFENCISCQFLFLLNPMKYNPWLVFKVNIFALCTQTKVILTEESLWMRGWCYLKVLKKISAHLNCVAGVSEEGAINQSKELLHAFSLSTDILIVWNNFTFSVSEHGRTPPNIWRVSHLLKWHLLYFFFCQYVSGVKKSTIDCLINVT